MSSTYLPISEDDRESEQEPKRWQTGFKNNRRNHTKSWTVSVMVLLLITNFATILHFSTQRKATSEPIPPEYAKQNDIALDTTWTRFWWNTEYSPKNHSESDALWDAILPSHGFVAMDEGWATERQWPESMRLPIDGNKRVYLLEAYHQLHCLVRSCLGFSGSEPIN